MSDSATTPSPNIDDWEFTVPANRVWGSPGYVLYRAKHIALSAAAIAGILGVPALAFGASPPLLALLAVPAAAVSGWIATSGRARAFQLAEGRRLAPWAPWRLPDLKSNAGRTLTPEFAQYQSLLDQAVKDKELKKQRNIYWKLMGKRHDRRDSKGRFTK